MTDNNNKRAETGPMQFGDDWPGVFVRGDNAMYYATILRQIVDNPEMAKEPLEKAMLKNLADLFAESKVIPGNESNNCQYLKEFHEVLKK